MGMGKDRRLGSQYLLGARVRRDQQTLNKRIERAENIAAGMASVSKHWFFKLQGAIKGWPGPASSAPAPPANSDQTP